MKRPVFTLQIVTPQGIAYSRSVFHALIPVENGCVGILAHHASYVTSSPGGLLAVRENETNSEALFRVGAGFFEVSANKASFFTQYFFEEGMSEI